MRKKTGDDHPDAPLLDQGIQRMKTACEELQRAAFADTTPRSR
jgi:hypothetical protein